MPNGRSSPPANTSTLAAFAAPPGGAIGDEDVAVRRDAHDARLLEAARKFADSETGRRFGRRARRPIYDARSVRRGARGAWRRQVGRRDLAAHPRRIGA